MSRRKVTKKVAIKCVFCKNTLQVDKTIKAALCSHCVARLSGSPQEIGKFPKDKTTPKVKKAKKVVKKKTTRKKRGTTKPVVTSADNLKKFGGSPGRGWHLAKKFVAPNGSVWSFGKMVKSAKKN